MPSARHQSLTRLLTEGPGVLRAVLTFVGIDVPEDLELQPGPDAVRDGGRCDHFADGTMVAHGAIGRDDGKAFVVEVQLGEDPAKHFTWPFYVVVLRNRLRCQTTLVVFTDSLVVAHWASRPIEIGCGTVRPMVIGPDQIPHDLSKEQSRRVPALAVLAIVAHGRGPEAKRLGRMAVSVTRRMFERGDERAILYMDVIHAYLDQAILGEILEEQVSALYQPISPYFKNLFGHYLAEGRREGRTECMAQMLERLLDQRGLPPSAEQRRRMADCNDEAQVQRWFDRAITATRVSEIFDA